MESILRDPLKVPDAAGEKARLIVQKNPAETLPEQLFCVMEKPEPLMARLLIVSCVLPRLNRKSVSAGPCVPSSRCPREKGFEAGSRSGACPWPLT